MNQPTVTFGQVDVYRQGDAEEFIKLTDVP
jgi:hypothetical protein